MSESGELVSSRSGHSKTIINNEDFRVRSNISLTRFGHGGSKRSRIACVSGAARGGNGRGGGRKRVFERNLAEMSR
eukprot:7760036-Karenia_brevis.AAC.1